MLRKHYRYFYTKRATRSSQHPRLTKKVCY